MDIKTFTSALFYFSREINGVENMGQNGIPLTLIINNEQKSGIIKLKDSYVSNSKIALRDISFNDVRKILDAGKHFIIILEIDGREEIIDAASIVSIAKQKEETFMLPSPEKNINEPQK